VVRRRGIGVKCAAAFEAVVAADVVGRHRPAARQRRHDGVALGRVQVTARRIAAQGPARRPVCVPGGRPSDSSNRMATVSSGGPPPAKSARGERWALRCNPSSGNLHPTEGYAVVPPLPGLRPVSTTTSAATTASNAAAHSPPYAGGRPQHTAACPGRFLVGLSPSTGGRPGS